MVIITEGLTTTVVLKLPIMIPERREFREVLGFATKYWPQRLILGNGPCEIKAILNLPSASSTLALGSVEILVWGRASQCNSL
jgi:hypothetical protein